MKKKFSKKILGVALTLLMLSQLIVPQLSVGAYVIEQPDLEEAEPQGMTIYRNGNVIGYYPDFGKGWCRALEESADDGVSITIQLHSDWLPNTEGGFYYEDDDEDEYGTSDGCLAVFDEVDIAIDLNGHTISRNLTTAKGGGRVFYVSDSNLTIFDTSKEQTGKITGGYNSGDGGAIYMDGQDSNLYIKGGTICGNKSEDRGGAIFAYNGSVYFEAGVITDNYAENGGGIYWDSRNVCALTGGIITGNTSSKRGGGVYVTDWGNVYLGGNVQIKENTGCYGPENVYISESDIYIGHTAGQKDKVPNVPFKEGACVGITCADFAGDRTISNKDSNFPQNVADYLVADDEGNFIYTTETVSGYMVTVDIRRHGVVYVMQEGSPTEVFYDFGKGWATAVKKSEDKPTTFKLDGNWYANGGVFYCTDEDGSEYGSNKGRLYIDDSSAKLTIDLNGYTISRNLKAPVKDGQVFRVGAGSLTIKDSSTSQLGKITGAYNNGDGGAFYMSNGSLYIEGGTITGNRCLGNGAGVYWYSSGNIAVTGGHITGNIADGHGGGVYVCYSKLHVGGDAVIYGNTGGNKTENVYLSNTSYYVNHAVGQSNIPNVPLKEGAVIGISVGSGSSDEYVFSNRSGNSGFDINSAQYFKADEHFCIVKGVEDSSNGGYKLIVTPSQEVAMQVIVGDAKADNFADFGRGWVYAVEQSQHSPTTIKLEADWYAPGGNFCYINGKGDEYGTDKGRMCLDDGDINLTIDLNGHTISRNLGGFKLHGQVFRVKSGSLTIKDSSASQLGKITGGYNDGDGGAFYMDNGSLNIQGGTITGNKCTGKGAGVYWNSSDVFKMTGGKITGNTANINGGGIYFNDRGDVYFGGSAVIDANTGGTRIENAYLSDEDVVFKYSGGQNGAYPFTAGAKIGLTCHEVDAYKQFSDADSFFDENSAQYFVSDDDIFFVDSIPDEQNGGYKLSVAYDYKGYVSVTPQGGETKKFYDLGKGWVYALKESINVPTTFKLEVDFVPHEEYFKCRDDEGSEYGTDNGRLHIGDGNAKITIDLNGHSINRNLTSAIEKGQVFYIKAGSLTIIDTSESKNGKITGGNSTDNGGGFSMEGGNLNLKSGSICGNKSEDYGGGIYMTESNFVLEGGSICENTSDFGAGAYIYNKCKFTIENGEISNNIGGGVMCKGKSDVYMKGGVVADNERKDGFGGGFYLGESDEGDPSMYMTGGSILRNKATGGAGIYWGSLGTLVMTGGVITQNHAYAYDYGENWNHNMGGGVHAYHFDEFITEIGSDPYIGGTIQIFGNTACTPSDYDPIVVESNLFLSGNDAKLNHAMGQKDNVPVMPLTGEAKIGISLKEEEVIADEDSKFDKSSLKHLFADCRNTYLDFAPDDDYYKITFAMKPAILYHDQNSKEATIYITKSGRYSLLFADYDGQKLKMADVVEYDFKKGLNQVRQNNYNIYMKSNDQVMLWYDTDNCVPVCDPLIIE